VKNLLKVTSQTQWEELSNSPTPLFVIFCAKWCEPCDIMIPTLEQLENKYDNFQFIQIDIDRNNKLYEEFDIDCIPTLIIFKNQKIVSRITDISSKESVLEFINKNIKTEVLS